MERVVWHGELACVTLNINIKKTSKGIRQTNRLPSVRPTINPLWYISMYWKPICMQQEQDERLVWRWCWTKAPCCRAFKHIPPTINTQNGARQHICIYTSIFICYAHTPIRVLYNIFNNSVLIASFFWQKLSRLYMALCNIFAIYFFVREIYYYNIIYTMAFNDKEAHSR